MQSYIRVLVLAISDMACMFLSWVCFAWCYWAVGIAHYPADVMSSYLGFWPSLLVFVAINAMFRLYHGSTFHPAAPVPEVEELRRLVASAIIAHAGIVTYIALTKQTTVGVSRVVIVCSGLITALMAQPVRNLARWVMFSLGFGRVPVLFVGSGAAANRLAAELKSNSYIGFSVVRRFRSDEMRRVVAKGRKLGVRTLVACMDPRILQYWFRELSGWFSHIEYVPTSMSFPVLGARAVAFGGLGGLEMVNQRQLRILRIEKLVLDKVLSLFAFLCFLPAFLVIPVLIKLTSRGPVLYRHERLGRGGERIFVWKFRSMYIDADERLERVLAENPDAKAEWEKSFKLADDPRVTLVGRFLRRTSLDELPQFFNVFLGQMSLIGPRPIIQEEVEKYGSSYAIFSSVKPGITGLWQVSGRSDTGYARRVELDTYYALNWSPWLDLWILLRTLFAVLLMRGAR